MEALFYVDGIGLSAACSPFLACKIEDFFDGRCRREQSLELQWLGTMVHPYFLLEQLHNFVICLLQLPLCRLVLFKTIRVILFLFVQCLDKFIIFVDKFLYSSVLLIESPGIPL